MALLSSPAWEIRRRYYESQADRERKRDALMKDPLFQDYLRRSAEMGAHQHQHQESRILKSTSFSPL
ncbi:MAG TPA: NIPSNAP family protein [Burkholderiales bacterium]|nr:NIPSNAP family protein [Burkholderiales bacterium]